MPCLVCVYIINTSYQKLPFGSGDDPDEYQGMYRLVFFFVALTSRVAFLCCAFVPGTLALYLPTLIL